MPKSGLRFASLTLLDRLLKKRGLSTEAKPFPKIQLTTEGSPTFAEWALYILDYPASLIVSFSRHHSCKALLNNSASNS
jgi:hypothetical protein